MKCIKNVLIRNPYLDIYKCGYKARKNQQKLNFDIISIIIDYFYNDISIYMICKKYQYLSHTFARNIIKYYFNNNWLLENNKRLRKINISLANKRNALNGTNPWIKKNRKKDKNGNDIVILKIQKTCKRKYGVKSFTQSKIFIDKSKNTRYIKNNGRYESKETRQKNINTCLLKYGVVNGGGSRQAQLKMHKKYYYLNKYFDSSWELEYFIYLTDNNIKFEYQPNISFKYYVDNKEYTYFPDFIVNNEIIELKGDQFFKEDGTMYCPFRKKNWTQEKYDAVCKKYNEKYHCMIRNNVKILKSKDMLIIHNFIINKYGNDYIKQFKKIMSLQMGTIHRRTKKT